MKRSLIIITIVIIGLFVIGIAKDLIIKSAITAVTSEIIGAPVNIDRFSFGLFSRSVAISGFKIHNPKGFTKGLLLNIAKANVVYDLGDLFNKKIHLINVEFELKDMLLEKNKEGQLNVDSLKIAKDKQEKPSKQLPLKIDLLKLGVGRLIYRDYSVSSVRSVKAYNIGMHKTYKNITSAHQLAALILTEPMKEAGIKGAQIYGVSALSGFAILPAAVLTKFAGRDSVTGDFNADLGRVYDISLGVLKEMGKITKEDKPSGLIEANIDSADVTLKFKKMTKKKTQVLISARRYLLPRLEIAGGVLYEISEKIK